MTIEDPVEYEVRIQMQVNREAGLTFSAMRSFLRPGYYYGREIVIGKRPNWPFRLTGHLVSTLHTNQAAGTIRGFWIWGLFIASSSLVVVSGLPGEFA